MKLLKCALRHTVTLTDSNINKNILKIIQCITDSSNSSHKYLDGRTWSSFSTWHAFVFASCFIWIRRTAILIWIRWTAHWPTGSGEATSLEQYPPTSLTSTFHSTWLATAELGTLTWRWANSTTFRDRVCCRCSPRFRKFWLTAGILFFTALSGNKRSTSVGISWIWRRAAWRLWPNGWRARGRC